METVRSTVDNANRTVHNAGTAAGVAANEMPRFNNNLNAGIGTFDNQATELNNNLSAGVGTFNNQASELNNNLDAGIGTFDNQASELNNNLSAGVGTFNNQASELNNNLDTGIDTFNNQADMMNQTAANGIDMLNEQGESLNMTADAAVEEVARDAESIEAVSEVISTAIAMMVPSIKLFVDILGPLQYVLAAKAFMMILQVLGVLPNQDNGHWKALNVTNTILQSMTEGYREVESPGIVQNITKSSVEYNKVANKIKSHFFYSTNNIVIKQLQGLGYFADDSIAELLKKVYVWNAFWDVAAQTSKFDRSTIIYFLDPCPKSQVLPHMEFTKIHHNVTIVNHFQAKQHLTMKSIKVHEGCFVQLEHLSICKIDATHGGKAHLHKCNVGWNKVSQIPFLFCGKPEMFDNPYNVCGTVSFHDCQTFDPSKSKYSKWLPKWSTCSNEVMRCPNNKDHNRGEPDANTIERTITNISDSSWRIKFKPDVGIVDCSDVIQAVADNAFADEVFYVVADPDIKESFIIMILPLGGQITFRVTTSSSESRYFSRNRVLGTLIFIDRNGEEYCHTYEGRLPDFTIVCPNIRPKERDVPEGEDEHSPTISPKEAEDQPKEAEDQHVKQTIVAVGRFGSGKSTLLNTLAGVYWNVTADGHFVSNHNVTAGSKVEKFTTSRSVKGCTVAAVATEISTFDGRELTVIDTVGYDDSVNAESFYNTSNLTEVMNRYNEISAVVIVVNSKDPRLTQGFLESLLCVPKSFKKKIQQNVMLVFTNWSADDEEQYGEEPHRGFTEQVKIIRAALGFGIDDDEITIPAFWMDNRPFKKYTETARHTIDNLRSFLDCVFTMPQLSCEEFKEMRALSQFERIVRKSLKHYFQPSNRNVEALSGFEKFLFECAHRRAKEIKKVTLSGCTASDWSKKLVVVMQQEIIDRLPGEIQKICEEADIELTRKLTNFILPNGQREGHIAKGLLGGGFLLSVSLAPSTFGISLVGLPVCLAGAYGYSRTWSREDVIPRIVFEISEERGNDFYSKYMDKFTSHVDSLVQELQECFEMAC